MKPMKPQQAALSGHDRKANGSRELYSVKWNNYPETILRVFRKYLREETLADITLSVDGGKSISCHRMILCACSTYFEEMLTQPNAIKKDVFFFRHMEFWELEALVAFMYFGEVRVERDKLTQLVEAAGSLKIKGLAPQTDFEAEPDFEDSDVESSLYSASELGPSAPASRMASNPRPVLSPTKRRMPAAPVPARKAPRQGVNGGSSKPMEKLRNALREKAKPKKPPAPVLTKTEQELLCNYEREAMKGWVKDKEDEVDEREEPDDVSTTEDTTAEAETEGGEAEDNCGDTADSGHKSADNERDPENDDDIQHVDLVTDEEGDEPIDEGEVEDDEEGLLETDTGVQSAASDSKRRYSYDQDFREKALAALDAGLSLKQCSDKFNVPRKTLAKWRQKDTGLSGFEDQADEQPSVNPEPRQIPKAPPKSQAPAVKQKRGPGVSIDTGDRAERLRNAMTLALGGTTVRQAAAQYEIPRTTLCAYMKRHGVTARRTFINKRNKAMLLKPKLEQQEYQEEGEDDAYDMEAYDEHGAVFAPDYLQDQDPGEEEMDENPDDNFVGAEGDESDGYEDE